MVSKSPLSKRIKRHVIGRTHTYFIATAPGLANLCLRELSSFKHTIKEVSVVTGGIQFKGRLQDCYLANLHLRTANRILMRVHHFKATSFRGLKKKAAEIPWELFLPFNSWPEIHASTKHCRLYHTDALRECLLEILSKHFELNQFAARGENSVSPVQKIFIRGEDDRFTLSLDSSGAHLHKRGLKRHVGKAPLRETSAAAALLLADYNAHKPLIDPMCGTGTFSVEAALIAKHMPPGWFREFAFMKWPAFSQPQWDYLKRQCEKQFSVKHEPVIYASDKDPTACRRLKNCLKQHQLQDIIKVSNKNFFDILPRAISKQAGWVVLNPPYGKRMGDRQESQNLYKTICAKLKHEYQGWKLILIAPSVKIQKQVPFNLKSYPLIHGGLKVKLMVGTIP